MRIAAISTLAVLLATPLLARGPFDEDDCRYKAPRNAATPAAGITKVLIHAEAGALKVDGTPGAARVVVNGTACTSDEDFLDRMTITLRKVGTELHIDAEIAEKSVIFGFFSARLDFGVSLPAGIPVEIDDGSGPIHVANTGALEIDDGSGEIQIRNVRGPVTVNDGSGSILIDGAVGAVEVEDGSGEIIIRNVKGDVEIEDGSGAIMVAHVEGSLLVKDDGSGSITAENVRKNLTIDDDGSGSVSVADVGGDFKVYRKSSGSIDHERVAGKVQLPTRR